MIAAQGATHRDVAQPYTTVLSIKFIDLQDRPLYDVFQLANKRLSFHEDIVPDRSCDEPIIWSATNSQQVSLVAAETSLTEMPLNDYILRLLRQNITIIANHVSSGDSRHR